MRGPGNDPQLGWRVSWCSEEGLGSGSHHAWSRQLSLRESVMQVMKGEIVEKERLGQGQRTPALLCLHGDLGVVIRELGKQSNKGQPAQEGGPGRRCQVLKKG